jgi:hypothetical protein
VCTVSAVRSADGTALRVMINRDERRLRMQARPPAVFEPDGVPAAWPIDQQAGGTWAAVTAHGLAFALLNVSSEQGGDASVSRGAVIPYLAAARDVEDALRRFAAGPAYWACRPFKLLIASLHRSMIVAPQGVCDVAAPFVMATSTLGDDLVEGPRQTLFRGMLDASGDAWMAQDRFHQHAWPDRRHLSVLMSRPEACTVSRTTIVMTTAGSELRYAALHDGWPAGIATPPVFVAHRCAVAA